MNNLPTVDSYMKNLKKSIKYVAINEIRDTLPIVFETKETNEEAISTIRSSFRNKNKLKTISNIAKDSEFYKSGNELLKNLKSSIKTGTFYSKRRADKSDEEFMKKLMGDDEEDSSDNFEFDYGGDLNDDSEESLNENADSLNELNEDLNSGFEANATAISNTTVESARYVGETIKSSAAMSYAQASEQTFILRSGFKSLDDSLKKLTEFNSDTLQKHVQNSMTFFDNTSKLLNEQNGILKEMLEMQRNVYKANQAASNKNKPSFNKYAEIVSSGGAVNLSEYFKNVKSNFAEWSEPMLMMLNLMKTNPLEALLQGGLSFIGSDSMKNAGANLNKTLSGAFGKYLSFLDKKSKDKGGFWSTLNDIFGVRNRNKNEVDTGIYEKGPMQFNGIANRAITEVIPGYLARIESALTGQEERYYNFKNGRWTNARKIRNKYDKELNVAAESTGLSDLFSEMSSSLNKVNYDNYNGTKISSKDRKEIFNHIIQTIIDKNGDIDDSFIVRRRDKTGHNTIDKEKFYELFGYDGSTITNSQKAMLDVIGTVLANTNESTRASLNNTVRQAKGAKSEFKQSVEDDTNSIYRLLFNNAFSGSRFVKYAAPYGEGSIESPYPYKPVEIPEGLNNSVNINNSIPGLHIIKKYKRKKIISGSRKQRKEIKKALLSSSRANQPNTTESITARKNSPYDYAKRVFYKINSVDELVELFDPGDVSTVKAFTGYISGLEEVRKLNEADKAVSDFIALAKTLDSSDYIEDCKELADYIDCKKQEKIAIKSKQFNKLPKVCKNFYYFVGNLVAKEGIQTSEALGKTSFDSNQYRPEYDYDSLQGKGLFEKLEKAKGIDKLGVLISYTKKITSMPFDILGGVIAKTDKIIYDLFFGNQQITDSSGRKVTGFFEAMVAKIGDAVESLYHDVKNRIWGDDQWKQYKNAVYNGVTDIVSGVKSAIGISDDKKDKKENDDKSADKTADEPKQLEEGKESKKEAPASIVEEYNKKNKINDDIKKAKEIIDSATNPSSFIQQPENIDKKTGKADKKEKKFIDKTIKSMIGNKSPIDIRNLGKINKSNIKFNKKSKGNDGSVGGAAYGLGMVPKTDLYTLHKGEAVIPAYLNPSYTGTDVDPAKHAKDEQAVAKKYGLTVKGYAEGTVEKDDKADAEAKKDKKSSLNSIVNWLKHSYPAALGEGTIGAVLGTVVAGPFGLIGGATLGAANYILKNSTEANNLIFGDDSKKSLLSRTKSGLTKILPKSITSFFAEQDKKLKNVGKYAAAGGTLGLIGGAIGGPVGLMGGIVLGASAGLLKNYDSAQKMVFGNHNVKGTIDKVLSKKYLKSVGLGALAGGVFAGPLGMLGGAMLGVAGQYASDSDKFKDWMFGARDPNTNERKYNEGYLGKIGEKILAPLGSLKDEIIHYMDENVFQPISRAFVPLTRYTQLGMRGIFKKVTKAFDAIINPSLRMPWYKNLPTILKGPAGRYVGHGLAGAAGGFMYGGPIGAILGGVLGGVSAYKVKDKTIAGWVGTAIKKLGTKPGKMLDSVTKRLDKKLIANGNMDSVSMSAQERIDFMSENGYSYNKQEYEDNDNTLATSSLAELKAMESTIKIMDAIKKDPKKSRVEIEGHIREAVKAIPGLSFTEQKDIMKVVRRAIEGQTGKESDTKLLKESYKAAKTLIQKHGFSDEQIEKFMQPIKLGISALAINTQKQEYAKEAIADKTKYLKKAYHFNVVDGDIDKALEQVSSEISIRGKEDENAEDVLGKGDIAIIDSNKQIEDEIKRGNVYLQAIEELLKEGKLSDKTQKAINDFKSSVDGPFSTDTEKITKQLNENQKIVDTYEDKLKSGEKLTKEEQKAYADAKVAVARNSGLLNDYKAGKRMQQQISALDTSLSSGYTEMTTNSHGIDSGNTLANRYALYKTLVKGKMPELSEDDFYRFYRKFVTNNDDSENTIKKIFSKLPVGVIRVILTNPSVFNKDNIDNLMDAVKYGIIEDNENGDSNNFKAIISVSRDKFKKNILAFAKYGVKISNASELLNLEDKDINTLEEIVKHAKKNKVAIGDHDQKYWLDLVVKLNNKELTLADIFRSHNANKAELDKKERTDADHRGIRGYYDQKAINKDNSVINSLKYNKNGSTLSIGSDDGSNVVSGAAYGLTSAPETALYTLHKGEAVIPAYANPYNNIGLNNMETDTKVVYSDSAKTMLTFKKTSDGGWSLDSGDKDSKEGVQRADEERNAIMSLGEYAKLKLKNATGNLKKKGSGLINAVKNSGFGSMLSSLKSIFGDMFGGALGFGDALLQFIPGYSLLKGKLFRGVGNKLGGLADKLGTKAASWGKAGNIFGKVGGKLLSGASFLIKNMADAASAAADAEESTPEFQSELEALHYIARKISGTEAATVAVGQAIDSNDNTPSLPELPGTKTTPKIDPKTGKPTTTPTTKKGFFSNLYSKAKAGLSTVGTKAMAAVGPVLGWVQNGLKKVFDFAAKFLPSNISDKISSFSSAILKKVSNPKVAVKVSERAAKKGIQLGLGPLGWAFLAGSIAVSFYQGYNNAESIWNEGSDNPNTDLSIGDKALCGICSVVANDLLLGIFTPSEILGIARSIFGKIKGVTDTIKEKASNALSTISDYKDKLLNAGKEMWNKVKTSFGNVWDGIKNTVGDAIQNIKDTYEKFKKIGYDTLVEILKSPIEWIHKKAKSIFGIGSGDDDKKTTTPAPSPSPTPKPETKPAFDPNVDPDKGIGTGENGTNTKKTWKEMYDGIYVRGKKVATGGPLSGNSLLRYRLASIGGGDMTPEQIWNTLTTKYHYSNQAAAAIMGSMQQESSFDPNASQHGGGIEASIAQGDGENGFGLCQWTGSRTQALVDFCNSNNLDPTTAEGQIAFMNHEMGQRGSNSAFNNAGSVDDALKVMKEYEGYGEVGNRENYARQIFQNQGKGIASAGSASGGSGSSSSGAKTDNSLFGKIDQLFNKAFAPYNSIFGGLFGDSNSNSSSGSSSSGGGGAGSAATDMSGTIDSGSTADKLLASLKAEANGDASVSAPYGEENHQGHTHGGIDIAVPAGTPIKTPVAGEVVDNSYGGGYGYFVQIKDKNNMDHLFPHMNAESPLAMHSHVNEGDVVGYVGSTGNSTGPHVHYEIDDDAVNPGAETPKPHINPGKYMGGPLSGDSTLKFRKKVNDLANAGNRAAIRALKKGYGSDNIGVGGPTENDSLLNIPANNNSNNSNIVVKDYSEQLNQIISLLGIIAGAVQNQAVTAGTNTVTLQNQVNNAMSTTTPNASILNIMKSMLNVATH